jgi:hypothetical protein
LLGWGFLDTLLAFCCCLAEIERHRTGDKRRRRRLSTVGRYAVVWRMIETEAIVIVIVDLNSFERERVSGESWVGRVIHCWFEQVTEEDSECPAVSSCCTALLKWKMNSGEATAAISGIERLRGYSFCMVMNMMYITQFTNLAGKVSI